MSLSHTFWNTTEIILRVNINRSIDIKYCNIINCLIGCLNWLLLNDIYWFDWIWNFRIQTELKPRHYLLISRRIHLYMNWLNLLNWLNWMFMNILNCLSNSNCRDEQVGGIDRIPQSNYYCFILLYMNCWCYGKPVEWNWLDKFGSMIFKYHVINQYLVLILEMGNLQWMM